MSSVPCRTSALASSLLDTPMEYTCSIVMSNREPLGSVAGMTGAWIAADFVKPPSCDVYRAKVGSLCLALESEESRTGAAEAIRALIEAIVLEPDGDQLKITLKGDLEGMPSAARDSKRSPDTGDLMVQ